METGEDENALSPELLSFTSTREELPHLREFSALWYHLVSCGDS
jgi:hypothetical protein